MSLANLDLNLLVPLDALLAERSVSRAAVRLGLSQPALSGALARLRRHFGDPLLSRVGNSYELTPLGVQLLRRTALVLGEVDRIFASEAVFDPSTARRTFTLLSSDYAMAVLGPRIAELISEQAPGVTVRIEHHDQAAGTASTEWLRAVDAVILPHGVLVDLPSADLFTDTWVCLLDRDHLGTAGSLTMHDMATRPWVLTYHGTTRFTTAGRQLQMLGVEPHVQAVVESFLALPYYLVGTRRLALVQRRLATVMTQDSRLCAVECPWNAVPVAEALWWHPIHDRDADHLWFRSMITRAAEDLDGRVRPHRGAGPG